MPFFAANNCVQVGRLFAQELQEICCVRAGLGSTCKMPLHEVNNRFQAGRLFAQFDWKLCFMKAGPGLTCETPLSQWTTPLLNGPFVSPSFSGSFVV